MRNVAYLKKQMELKSNEVSEKKEKNDSESNKQFDQQTEGSFGTTCKYSI